MIHGKIDRGDYTVEKVFFASLPGHYVSGNLYRPSKDQRESSRRAVSARPLEQRPLLRRRGERRPESQLDQGAENTHGRRRYPLQARMVELARLGCVVFHYDMVGVRRQQADRPRRRLYRRRGRTAAAKRVGLQTFNSIRALDFLTSLPDVDPEAHRRDRRQRRRHADVSAVRRRSAAGRRLSGRDGLDQHAGGLRVRERPTSCGSASTTWRSPPCLPPSRWR